MMIDITEIFCFIDDFFQEFEPILNKMLLKDKKNGNDLKREESGAN